MNKKHILSAWFFLFTFFSFQTVHAAGEVEYLLEKTITSMTPVFMEGHPGDINWIEGFVFEGNIFLKGGDTPLGTFNGEVNLLSPPLRTAEVYDQVFIKWVNVLPGIGSFYSTGTGVGLGSSTNNETTFAWSAAINNGTGAFANTFGLSAGNGVANIFTGEGTITEVINIRTGY